MHPKIAAFNAEQLKKDLPQFKVGDTIKIHVRVQEEEGKFRTQMFEGVVIRKKGSGINQVFSVRRISFGEGVERTFPYHSPTVQKVEVTRGGKVRRAKLYYLRKQTGKKGKIEEERRQEPVQAPTA